MVLQWLLLLLRRRIALLSAIVAVLRLGRRWLRVGRLRAHVWGQHLLLLRRHRRLLAVAHRRHGRAAPKLLLLVLWERHVLLRRGRALRPRGRRHRHLPVRGLRAIMLVPARTRAESARAKVAWQKER